VNFQACPSLIELLALRDTGEPESLTEHVRGCGRCQALLAELPEIRLEDIRSPELPDASLSGVARPVLASPAEVLTGQLWLAAGTPEDEEREVVAVIGRSPEPGLILVAPTSSDLTHAADSDLIVRESALGYPHLVCVWNQGTVEREQLQQYVGRLDRPAREDLVSLYRWLLGASERQPLSTPVGPSIDEAEDARLIFRALQQDRLRRLWRQADERLGQEAHQVEVGATTLLEGAAEAHAPTPTLGQALEEVLSGPEWDVPSLLDSSGAASTSLQAMRADGLDLTGRSDVVDVAKVLRVVKLDDHLDLVRASLERSSGGLPQAPKELGQIAARSRSDVSEEQRTKDVYRRTGKVDRSAEGRRKAIEAYLGELETELDD
jgi:hypothetical protein